MKLDNNNSERMSQQQFQQQQSQQTRRSTQSQPAISQKPMDIKEQKIRLKQEKIRKEKEAKEREKQEKIEKKERKEREKMLKKGGGGQQQQQQQQQQVPGSATTSALNKIRNNETNLPSSISDNFLNRNKVNNQMQAPMIPKGRYRCQIVYLDESVKNFDIDKNALGEDLMTLVCQDLELIEKEYFSLTYRDVNNMKFWLDHEKKIKAQLKGFVSTEEPVFNFEVKFYPPEPNVLQEEITRYLLTLQLRHDIMDGKLPCTFVTHALLGSYTVQAELGDYDELTNATSQMNVNGIAGFDYLEGFCFAPNQTPELLAAIANCHKDNKGQSPAEAEMHYLENAVKLAMYGVDLHNAKDSDGVDILIGVSASGLLVFRDHLRINRFAWPKILKISYKRNHFYLKLRPSEFEKYETTIGFRCPNHKAAKRLWKIAVEHHAFFRLREPEQKTNRSRLLPNFNSNFRYTGSSTYMQSRHRSIERNQPDFTRSLSKRLTQSMDRGLAMENPNATPGSVQSAAFNHFNRTKPHMSLSNLRGQNQSMNESQDDLAQGADYNVNPPSTRYNPQNNQYQQVTTPNNNTQRQISQPLPNMASNGLKSLIDRIPKDSANLSMRSNESNTPSGIYQSVQRKQQNNQYQSSTQNSYNQQNYNNNNNNNNQQDSFEQLDEYYTSVDKNMVEAGQRTPSNKISTPIINDRNPNQPQQNRYVPSRQPPQQQQQQQQQQYQDNQYQDQYQDDLNDQDLYDEFGNQISPPQQYNQRNQDSQVLPSPVTSKPVVKPSVLPKPSIPKFKPKMDQQQQQQQQQQRRPSYTDSNISNSYRNQQQIASSNNSSYRNQQQPQAVPTARQNLSRPQPPPPPVPADRSSINSQRQKQQQMRDEEEYQENQRFLLEQQRRDQQIRNQQYQRQQQQPYQARQNQQQGSIRGNETSHSGSILSTPNGSSRVRKDIITSGDVNHKDLLLQAIKMATDLDPNLEVEKVEITTED